MKSLRDILLRNIARKVCRLTGSTGPYRKIRGLFRRDTDFSKSNCHGSTLYMLGLNRGNSNSPEYKSPEDMDAILSDYFFRSQANNGIVIAFRGGDSTLKHTAINYPTIEGNFMLHQSDIGSPFELTTLTRYLERNPDLKTEASIEYHKYFPDGKNISVYSLRSGFNPGFIPGSGKSSSPF